MKHIFLVEDEEGIRTYLTRVLERAGYRVTPVDDGDKALELIESSWKDKDNAPDLLITDNGMPHLTGLELVDELNSKNISVPVIIVTASEERNTVIEALRKGCYEFIDKPVTGKELVNAVARVFDKIEQEKKAFSSTRNFRVNNALENYGNYKLLKILGQGTAGTVFLCEHNETHEKYALKTLKFDGCETQLKTVSVKRFVHEGYAISQLNHPNIVNFIEFGYGDAKSNKAPFIIMEYFESDSLKKLLEKNDFKIDLDDSISIIYQLATALSVVHERNIFHRDIKPGNILVNDKLHTKLTDFGVCNLPSSDLTMTSELLGSPAYIAPEYLLQGKADKHADIYSLGVVAYELFCGRRPFDAENFQELRAKVIHEHPIAPTKLVKSFPEELQLILAGMLQKNPKKRYQNVVEIIDDLDKFKQSKIKISSFSKLKNFLSATRSWK